MSEMAVHAERRALLITGPSDRRRREGPAHLSVSVSSPVYWHPALARCPRPRGRTLDFQRVRQSQWAWGCGRRSPGSSEVPSSSLSFLGSRKPGPGEETDLPSSTSTSGVSGVAYIPEMLLDVDEGIGFGAGRLGLGSRSRVCLGWDWGGAPIIDELEFLSVFTSVRTVAVADWASWDGRASVLRAWTVRPGRRVPYLAP